MNNYLISINCCMSRDIPSMFRILWSAGCFPVSTCQENIRSGDTVPHILNLGNRWSWVISLRIRLLYHGNYSGSTEERGRMGIPAGDSASVVAWGAPARAVTDRFSHTMLATFGTRKQCHNTGINHVPYLSSLRNLFHALLVLQNMNIMTAVLYLWANNY